MIGPGRVRTITPGNLKSDKSDQTTRTQKETFLGQLIISPVNEQTGSSSLKRELFLCQVLSPPGADFIIKIFGNNLRSSNRNYNFLFIMFIRYVLQTYFLQNLCLRI